ncbi:sugar transporter [Flavobacteriaceae bacterium R38]|nr:sugar transporter [Flavobacteriaceae bacterium R38]
MSRVKNTILNARINLIFYIASTFVAFFTRRIFLEYLGDEFIGLTGTIQGILGFLNLAELGIGTAIGFTLYKPLYEKDREEINRIISLFGFLYRKVGLFILSAGVLISFLFGIIFSGTSFSLLLIYYCFFAFLASSLIGYFLNYHQSLLNADQKEYILAGYLQSANLIRQLLQALLAIYFKNLYLWISLELIFSIIYSIIIRYKIKKVYPWLILNQKNDKSILKRYPKVITKIKQLFIHKISTFVTFGTDQLLIFALVNIQSVAFFGNYNLIFTQIGNLVNRLFSGTAASIGNLVAENNISQIQKVFWEMMGIRFFIAGSLFINLFFLVDYFIAIWLGDKYILDNSIILLMLINFFMVNIRAPIDNFIAAYGLFSDTWAPLTQLTINLIVSLIFGYYWGISGIMLGTVVSMFSIVILWKPYYLYSLGFKKSVLKNYWVTFLKLLMIFSISLLIIYLIDEKLIMQKSKTYKEWILYAFKINFLIITIYFPLMYFLDQGFKNIVLRFKGIILKINK